ncbi:TetR/AcrR family transcriptional regulator [Phenylobacterium aquaticum]|uniref:TetR/AcrR family transcriptional regulator n=1 Tax=Phenylobacterium aquaticum TaxID=1763816 RepID=UPI0026EACCDE|nr:TetR/AcrR family transcriptional regulator [Phenylobacterium aquaticum]
MRYSQTHKEETRKKLLDAAAAAVRIQGPDRVAVAEVMAQAGLTHGGFYAHFKSKDEMVGAAIGHAFDRSRRRFQRLGEGRSDTDYLSAFVDNYVSAAHRDAPERGCPIATLSNDLPRQGEPARAAFDAGVKSLISSISGRLTVGAAGDRDALAGSLVAEMAGAVALARAVSDREFSDRLLSDARARVKARMGLTDVSSPSDIPPQKA